ncbi:MAG: VOC family protein [Alphaproteobacteria bacterium]|nr:VOC family protein [Alphaproteobacteria bacterium]
MTTAIDGIDHGIFIVRDLDRAAAAYARLGFTVTGLGRHTGLGTGNRLVMLGDDYIELLGVLEPNEYNEPFRACLERREGLWMLALSSSDAAAASVRFRAAGIPADEPLRFTRPVETPDAKGEAAFCLTRLDAAATPHALMFLLQHFTPDLVWHPAWQGHENGALGIGDITVVVADPAAPAAAYDALFGAGSYTAGAAGPPLATGRQPIRFVTPAARARRFGAVAAGSPADGPPCAALSIRVGNAARAAAALAANGVPHEVAAGGAVRVAPAHACGAIVEFAAG